MAYILDTHALIFFGEGQDSLPGKIRAIIKRKEKLFVSIVSLWEISIKNSLGKLPLAGNFEEIPEFLRVNSIEILDITFKDLILHRQLPGHHKDPFDRILIAQAQRTGFTLITRDQEVLKYKLKTLW